MQSKQVKDVLAAGIPRECVKVLEKNIRDTGKAFEDVFVVVFALKETPGIDECKRIIWECIKLEGPQEKEEMLQDGMDHFRAGDPPGQGYTYVPPGNMNKELYRLSTFQKFPSQIPVKPRDLAASGFFYTGYRDRVKCFSWGRCVENWVEGDDMEQARWHRGTCNFINRRECGNIPMDSGSNATTSNPAPRFFAADFRFAEILSPAYETRLRGLDLRHENVRLTTFHRFPTTPRTVSPENLAKSGFFFLGNLDRVYCFSCGGVLRNWSRGNVVDSEHGRHFGHCKMVRGIETANFPIGSRGDTVQRMVHEPADLDHTHIVGLQELLPFYTPSNPHMSLESSRLETCDHRWPVDIADFGIHTSLVPSYVYLSYSEKPGLQVMAGGVPQNGGTSDEMYPCLNPVNPDMREESKRLESFGDRWPSNSPVSVKDLVEAGYIYIERDRVKCWYCNGGLQDWEPGDDPWVEHAEWFPSCEFLLHQKGTDFLQKKKVQVVLMHEEVSCNLSVVICHCKHSVLRGDKSKIVLTVFMDVRAGDVVKIKLECENPPDICVKTEEDGLEPKKITAEFLKNGDEEIRIAYALCGENRNQTYTLELKLWRNGVQQKSIPASVTPTNIIYKNTGNIILQGGKNVSIKIENSSAKVVEESGDPE